MIYLNSEFNPYMIAVRPKDCWLVFLNFNLCMRSVLNIAKEAAIEAGGIILNYIKPITKYKKRGTTIL
ncbi:MAG: hypothetical protein Ct9H300mP23_06250 [Nitrospinota bacterium]|nr:MAG: hypothetical protein Ct9H300mP23_06250 [Nitrospinota bacterium]